MKQIKRLLFTLTLFATALFAGNGELSVLVFKNGAPVANAEVSVDGAASFVTDKDGEAYIITPEGGHKIAVVVKENGKPLGVAMKSISVVANKNTQVIVTLTSTGSLSGIDVEAPDAAAMAEAAPEETKALKTGTLMAQVLSAEDGKPVANARVFVRGSSIDIKTDKEGRFSVDLPEGERTLSIIHTEYSSQTLSVAIIGDETLMKRYEMTPASLEMEEFVVLAPHIEGSVAAVIAEERTSDAVSDVLGSEEFSKSGDSSVASALKRVSGITIVGGKYVYVRGLGDRYSTVMLNDLHVPSPEPTKRVVPLDIFPTTVVENIAIQKSFTGDLPASFGGGTVLIRSKDIPAAGDGYLSVGMELIVNDSIGEEGTTNGDNSTGLPSSVINGGNLVSGDAVTQDVLNYRTLNHESTSIVPGGKFEVAAGKSFAVTDDISIGASGTLYYKSTSEYDESTYNKFFYDLNTDSIYHDNETDNAITTLHTEMGGMLNLGINYDELNKLKYTFFTTNHTSDRTVLSSINYTGSQEDREKTYLEYVENGLTTHQISGVNEFRFSNSTDGYFDNIKIDWALENATAFRDEPGTVSYNYLYQTSGLNWDRKTWYYYFILDDEVKNYRADMTLPFKFNDNDNYTKAGVFIYNKSRDFDSRRFKMLSSNFSDMPQDMDTIYDLYANDLDFSASYRSTDSYQATQDVTAFYLKQLLSVTHDIDVIASVRYESSEQQLTDAAAVYDPLETSDLFPSLGLTWRTSENTQMRLGYSTTISRPDFREFSNTRYIDPVTENEVYGNPDLEATYIDHFDLKYEWYMEADEMLSLALFGKEFTHPIEKVIKRNDGQANTFEETYQNADSATSYGVEVDFRKRFGFISDDLQKLLFASNVALIESNIQLNSDPTNAFTSRLTTTDRAMQGQSPYVINLTFGYDDPDSGDSALFLFNQIGERIVSLGTDHNEDIYEQPFAKLDFVTQWKLNNYFFKNSAFNYSIKLKANNILDSEKKFTQGDLTTLVTKPGREVSMSLKITY